VFDSHKASVPSATPQVEDKSRPTDAGVVTAPDLTEAFGLDDKAAAKKYGDQPQRIKGVVRDVNPDTGIVWLKGHNGDCDVVCHFNEHKDAMQKVEKGQTITVEGVCQGQFLLGSVKVYCSNVIP
jgi:hypothetical protein